MKWNSDETPVVSYEENKDRILTETEWQTGETMEYFLLERYKIIVRSHYRTWHGLCYVSAGATLIGGANPYLWFTQGIETSLISLCVSACIALLFLLIAHFLIGKDMRDDLRRIDAGKFLWKSDTVYARAPDHYPKKSRIWIASERESVVILQAFFWFRKGDVCFVVKENEESKDLQAFII